MPVAGWLFNQPQHIRRLPRARIAGAMSIPHPFKLKGSRNIILDTIKRGEDDHFSTKSKQGQTVILRLYEAFGGHGDVTISTELAVESATICDVSWLGSPVHPSPLLTRHLAATRSSSETWRRSPSCRAWPQARLHRLSRCPSEASKSSLSSCSSLAPHRRASSGLLCKVAVV